MLKAESSAPEPRLRPFIRAYVQREARLGTLELVEPVVARLGVMLEFEFAGPYEVLNYGSEVNDDTFPISVIGPQTWRRARLVIRGHVESLVVMFQPSGFHTIFGTPTAPLSETGIEGHALLGAEVSHLRERLGNMDSFAARVRELDHFFMDRLRAFQGFDPIDKIAKALSLLTAPGPLLKVSDAAQLSGMNLRQLERKSLDYTGVTPKDLRRIARFSRALRLRNQTDLTWTEIAHATEYHDHMHMVRDFRIFAGESPTFALEEIEPEHLINF